MASLAARRPTDYHLYPTPTQAQFLLSEAVINVIVGYMGSGKSFACIMGIFAHAQRNGVPLEVAIIRDTHENIKNSVVVAFNEFFGRYPDLPYKWRSDFHDLTIYATPRIHCRLFGIDDMTGLTRLQGPEYGLVWLEEVAPYTDSHRTNAGISEDTFNAALVRCARQQNVRARLQLSSNPPDEDHWLFRRLLVPPDGPVSPETPLITKRVFQVPVGENIHLKEEARQATMAAYMHDPAAYARFVLGQSATRFPGKRVAENFNPDWHVATEALDPLKGLSGWISFDSWGHPAAVLGQQWPDGRIWVLDCCEGAADIRGLIQDEIKPRLQTPRWKEMCRDWRYLGDCTMLQPDQSNIETSAAKLVEQSFPDDDGYDALFEPGPSTWHLLRNGLQHTLRWTTKGHPTLLIDPVHCKRLITGLKGAWHYPTSRTGVVTRNTPVKDEYCVDAETEILTLDGWKAWDALSVGTTIYAYDLSQQSLVLDTVQNVWIYNDDPLGYDMMHVTNQSLDMMVTPDHRCVASRRTVSLAREIRHPYELVAAKDLHSGHYLMRAIGQNPHSRERVRGSKDREYSDDFIRLCAWVMTEGSYHSTNSIVLTQSRSHNPQYIEEINAIALRYPSCIFQKTDILPGQQYASAAWGIRYELNALIRHLMPSKYPSAKFIAEMTMAQKRFFLYEAIKGDGDWGPSQPYKGTISRNRDMFLGTPKHSPRIACGKAGEADAIQIIATLIGLRATISHATPHSFKVTLHRSLPHTAFRGCEVRQAHVPFVWCPETQTHTWIARRNRTIFVTGNSHICDAAANAFSVLCGWDPPKRYLKKRTMARNIAARRRAKSYVS